MENFFQTHALTEQEQLAGCVLTTSNLKILQNERTMVAMDLLNTIGATDDEGVSKQQAYLKGQLDMLTTIIDRHIEIVNKPKE